jgi:ATP-dependent DNA helicase RecG
MLMRLSDSVSSLPLVGPVYAKRLKKLGIDTINDLLHHVPNRYIDFRNTSNINTLQIGDIATVKGEVTSIKNQYTKSGKKIQIAQIDDKTGKINVIWFNQPYLIRNIEPNQEISIAGEINWFGRTKAFISPEYEMARGKKFGVHTGRLIPVYPETKGVSSKWLRGRINFAYPKVKNKIKDYLPKETRKEFQLENIKRSIKFVHFPENLDQARNGRKRLALNELLFFQLTSLKRKREWKRKKAVYELSLNKKEVNNFIKSLPFELTKSQKRTINELLNDLSKDTPMNRLLEGDVGSGKTVVAACACLVSFLNGYQTVIMAPTQILAEQHFNTLKEGFESFKLRAALITSQKQIKDPGSIDLFIGTHSLIHNKVNFDNVALVVIDEQHRFGVKQRSHLVKKSKGGEMSPHVLTMTATPIPRTIALTAYGDLDLSTLDELPKGRIPITTWIVSLKKRESAYVWVQEQIIKNKIQAFVVCPLIEESDKETMKSIKAVTTEYERLKRVFQNLKIGLLHGRLKAKEKDRVVSKFKKGELDVLVTTPVVEVGIDIPNANIMIIEGADRFGLAQLHQLRGRIGRGDKKSYCLLFAENPSKRVNQRLSALKRERSGFKLAEIDLKLRGPGEIFGIRQHGFPELKIASWQNFKLIKNARKIAEMAYENPKMFKNLLDSFEKLQNFS